MQDQGFDSLVYAPTEVYGDNGTNFKRAECELKKALKMWNQSRITESLGKRSIQWYFNPPQASHQGGVWGRMIRSVRKITTTTNFIENWKITNYITFPPANSL